MPVRMKVPYYAKKSAREGLKERVTNKAGLTPKQAKKLGIYSGVARARQIINNKFLEEDDLRSIARFYLRFRNMKSSRSETALKLWGGRRFGRLLATIYYSKRRSKHGKNNVNRNGKGKMQSKKK